MRKMYNVKDFGAVADGVTLDTEAFNRAVGMASKTGGVVFVSDGEYLIGGVRLFSNIRLEMSDNAILRGSDCIKDYACVPYDPENKYSVLGKGPYGTFAKHATLFAYDAENIEIVGGKILFNDLAYDIKYPLDPIILDEEYIMGLRYIRQPSYYCQPVEERPVGLYLSKCKNVTVKNTSFEKSPIYSVWSLYCENLTFQGVRIRNSKYQWNGDGLHFSACRQVKIYGCDIDASDDCIAIDGNCGGSSYGFIVKDCRLKTCMHVIRLFTGLDFGVNETCNGDYEKYAVRDIQITDCTVENGCGVLLICAFDGNVRDVELSNVRGVQSYEGTALGFSAKAGAIRNICVKDCSFACDGIGYYCAQNNGKIENVVFENCDFTVTPKTKYWGDDFPDGVATHTLSMPYAWVCKNVESMTLQGVRVCWNKAVFSDSWSKTAVDKLKAVWGEERIKAIEPKTIRAIQSTNSNLRLIDCDIDDYVF